MQVCTLIEKELSYYRELLEIQLYQGGIQCRIDFSCHFTTCVRKMGEPAAKTAYLDSRTKKANAAVIRDQIPPMRITQASPNDLLTHPVYVVSISCGITAKILSAPKCLFKSRKEHGKKQVRTNHQKKTQTSTESGHTFHDYPRSNSP